MKTSYELQNLVKKLLDYVERMEDNRLPHKALHCSTLKV